MAGWQSDAPQFKGDMSEAMKQMHERGLPQVEVEESPQEQLERQAYEAEQASARDIQEQVASLRKDVEYRRSVEAKLARDAEIERRGDSTNYYFVPEEGNGPHQIAGKMYYTAQDGKTYLVQDGNRIYPKPVYVKNPPRRLTDKEEMDAAVTRSKSRRASSQLPF